MPIGRSQRTDGLVDFGGLCLSSFTPYHDNASLETSGIHKSQQLLVGSTICQIDAQSGR